MKARIDAMRPRPPEPVQGETPVAATLPRAPKTNHQGPMINTTALASSPAGPGRPVSRRLSPIDPRQLLIATPSGVTRP